MTRFTRTLAILLMAIFVAISAAAQTQGIDILLSKARSLEARGRMDLAAQNWHQVLLANPNQVEALAGLARYAKENGQAAEERDYIGRLKKINPKDPEIAAIEKMRVITPQERDRLNEAGRLAMQRKPDEAMKIYREVFGNEPPSGKWAEPYYETEAASSGGREKAIAQLRSLCASDRNNEIYHFWLGRVLVNDAKTRMEGLQKLESLHDPGAVEQARTVWRQALLWEKENPAVLSSVNAYLQRYPDQELQNVQKSLQQKQEHLEEEASKARGFQALQGKDLATAEQKFEDVLRRSPDDANAVAGLAFVRLNQKRFDDAVTLFVRARALSPKRADVRDGYETAKFWSLMQRGSAALQQNQPEVATAAYQEALALHPRDEQAMLGLAQADVREKKLPDAESQFTQVLNQSPNNTDAITGLAFLRVQQKQFDQAAELFDKARKLLPNRPNIEQAYKDAKYWSFMQHGAQELDRGRADAAISDYRQALAIRPAAVDGLQGLAGAAERGGNYAEAAQAYQQLTSINPADTQNWLGLMRVQIAGKDAKGAIATAQRIPPTIKSLVETRPDYLSQLALEYFKANQPEQGKQMLERAMAGATSSEPEHAVNARLEIASTLVKDGEPDRAIEIYRQTTQLHPKNAIAWEGLIGAYSQQRDYAHAKSAVGSMPRDVFNAAAEKSGFLNSVAAVYSADGDCSRAEQLLSRSFSLDRAAGRPPDENAQLLLADIWRREQNYAKAGQAYREVISRDPNSADAWQGYVTVLHEQHDERALVSESQRMPRAVRAQLERNPGFLVLLAGAQSTLGHNAEGLQLLQQARQEYVSQNQTPPTDLDLQIAWAMLNDQRSDPRLFLQKVKSRSDLTDKQHEAIDEIWSTWSVRMADEAMKDKKPERAISVLMEAQRDLPRDPKIYATLASVYARRHDYQKAMSVYESWGMKGAEPGDYRAAAGTALAWHKDQLLDLYLNEGLQAYPDDPALLEMKGKLTIAHGNYKQGQIYLKSALRAAKNPAAQRESFTGRNSSLDRLRSESDGGGSVSSSVSTSQVPGCRPAISYVRPQHARLILASAGETDQDNASQPQSGQTPANQTPPSQNPADQNPTNQNPANQAPANQAPANQAAPIQTTPTQPAPTETAPTQNNPEPTNGDPVLKSRNSVTAQSSPEQQERLQDEIDVVQNRNTPYADMGTTGTGRAGDPGIDRLIVIDGFGGASAVGGNTVRLSLDAHGLYLFSGTPNGASKSRFGTLAPGATFGQQSTGGMTGELQLSTSTFGLDFGATPHGFPIQNVTGGLRFRPLNGPFTFTAIRDSVKDSMLSYAGVRDPGTGIIWGGVASNTGIVQFDHKNKHAGGYANVTYSYLTGMNVPTNWSASGTAGFYIVVAKGLSVGLGATGMHYDKNLSYFSLGQGGYFSPQRYGLAAIPISWFSRHERFEYEIRASLGAQYIGQDASQYFPTRLNTTPPNLGFYASTTDVGPNYSFLGRLGYRIAPHAYFETFATASNARNYATQTVGFSLKIMVHPLPTHTDLHVDSVPDWKGNQPFGIQP